MTSVNDALKECRDSCAQTLQILERQPELEASALRANAGSSTPDFSLIRSDYVSLLALIDSHVTKVGMSFKPPITKDGAIRYLKDTSSEVGRLALCALSVPVTSGRTIRKELIWNAQEVAESVQGMNVGLLLTSDEDTSPPSDYLRHVGSVHSSLDEIRSSLSTDNGSAVEKRWQSNCGSLEDALRECKELVDQGEAGGDLDEDDGEDEEEDEDWGDILGENEKGSKMTTEELEMAKKVYPLLRFTSLLHKKLIKHYRAPEVGGAVDLDQNLALSNDMIGAFDEVVAALLPTQEPESIKDEARSLVDIVHKFKISFDMTNVTKDFTAGASLQESDDRSSKSDDLKWFKTCFEQIDKAAHNIGV